MQIIPNILLNPNSEAPTTGMRHIQENPVHYPSLYYLWHILVLPSHLRLGLQSDIFPLGFPINILQAFLFSPTCLAHLILFYFIILTIFGAQVG
jgi:hypothetical protein